MKLITGYFIPALCLLRRCHALEPIDCPANGDPCADAVTDTYRGPTFTAQAKADCSSFQEDTLYGYTTTITGYPPPIPTAGIKTRPIYVSEQCTLDSDYASACSCYGFPAQTVHLVDETTTITIPFPTTATDDTTTPFPMTGTITTTITIPYYTSSATTTETPRGASKSSYSPCLPFSYSQCDFDPLNGGPFNLLGPNGHFIIPRNNKAVEFSASEGDDSNTIPGCRFYRPSNTTAAAANVFDIIIPGFGGEKTKYLAVLSNGDVRFVDRSSNGQNYVPSPDGSGDGSGEAGQYVTTIWSVQCNGFATAGIVGGTRFEFTIRDNGDLAVGSWRAGRRLSRHRLRHRMESQQKSVTEIGGFYIMPKAVIVPPVGNILGAEGLEGDEECLKMYSGEKASKAERSASDQCVSEDWKDYFIPKFEFQDGCSFLHECWATCTQIMTSCNEAFLSMILSTCDSAANLNSTSSPLVSPPLSTSPSCNLTACHNLAHFTHYHLSSTPHAFALYASIYSQACEPSSSSTSNCPQAGAPGSSNNTTDTDPKPGAGSSTPLCTPTSSNPYLAICPIFTSTSPTKKGSICVDLSSDPAHCGRCNISCPSGSICVHGACSSPSCKGRAAKICGDWNTGVGASCGGKGSSCLCVAEAKGEEEDDDTGFCIDGKISCSSLNECEGSEQCRFGEVCVRSCCGMKGVCVEPGWCVSGGGDARLFGTVGGDDTVGRKFKGP